MSAQGATAALQLAASAGAFGIALLPLEKAWAAHPDDPIARHRMNVSLGFYAGAMLALGFAWSRVTRDGRPLVASIVVVSLVLGLFRYAFATPPAESGG